MAHLSNEKNLIVKYLLFLGNDATQFFWGFVKKNIDRIPSWTKKVNGKYPRAIFRGSSVSNISGQIIATSPDLTTKGGLVREIPLLFQGNLWLVKYYNLARYINDCFLPFRKGASTLVPPRFCYLTGTVRNGEILHFFGVETYPSPGTN